MNEQNQTTPQIIAVVPNDSEKRHEKEDVFQAYLVWKSLPAVFKNPPPDRKTGIRMSIPDFLEILGVVDEQVIQLSQIKNQNEFAERFHISIYTCTDWNKEIKERDPMEDIRKGWATGLVKNVINSLYNKALRKGDAFEVKLFMQLVTQWNEKQVVEHDYKGVKSITYEIIEPKHDVETNTDQTTDKPEASASPENVERQGN